MVSSGISQNIMPVSQGTQSVSAVSKTQSVDFGSYMNKSMANAGYNRQNVNDRTNNSSISANKVKNGSDVDKTFKQNNNPVNKTDNVKEDLAESKIEGSDIKEKLEAVSKTIDEVKEAIKEELGITDEELENAMATIGMSQLQILDSSKLTELVVQALGEESAVSILTDSDLLESIADMCEMIDGAVSNLEEEFDMTLDEITDFVIGESVSDEETPESKLADCLVTKTPSIVVETVAVEENVNVNNKNESNLDKVTSSESQTESSIDASQTKITDLVDSKESFFESSSQGDDNTFSFEQGQNQFINNLAQAVDSAFEVTMSNTQIDSVSIINQIVESVKANVSQEISSMEIVLNPEHLGKLNLNVEVKEGIVTASITAQNEAVRQAIENQIVILKDNMNNQGLKVEAIEVTVESHAFESAGENAGNNSFAGGESDGQHKSRRPLRLDSLADLLTEDLTDEEQLVLDMMANDGNQINFTA